MRGERATLLHATLLHATVLHATVLHATVLHATVPHAMPNRLHAQPARLASTWDWRCAPRRAAF